MLERPCKTCSQYSSFQMPSITIGQGLHQAACRGQWEKIGEVVGGPAQNDTMDVPSKWHNGQQYDFVVDVDFEDGVPPKKLAFNRSDNPYNVAERCGMSHHMQPYTISWPSSLSHGSPYRQLCHPASTRPHGHRYLLLERESSDRQSTNLTTPDLGARQRTNMMQSPVFRPLLLYRFLAEEELPMTYRQQVVDYILNLMGRDTALPSAAPANVDPFTSSGAYVAGASAFPAPGRPSSSSDPFTGVSF